MAEQQKGKAKAQDPSNPYGYPAEDIEGGKLMAILSYVVPFIFLVPIVQKDNHFSLFHAKQVLLLIIGYAAVTIIGPFTGCLAYLLYFPLMAFSIIGLIYAVQGQYKPMPLIGQYAEEWFKGIKKAA